MGKVVNRSSIRYLFRHPWQLLLSVLGIAMGVAVVVAIDLANQSAENAFELSMDSVSGKATHQIVGGSAGLPDSLYRHLRVAHAYRQTAPVVEDYVTIPQSPGRTLILLGVDPFAERPFRPYLGKLRINGDGGLGPLVSQPATAVMGGVTAREIGVAAGDSLEIQFGPVKRKVLIIGLLEGDDQRSNKALSGVMLTDIATAQELFGMSGRLSRIDLIIPQGEAGEKKLAGLKKLLPATAEIISSRSRSAMMNQMTSAFKLNLTALSLLTLIVGMFLIYNTMTFSVVQRRQLIGLMRAIGVTRKEIFRIILGEALLMGIAGTALGILIGVLLGRGLVELISRTINDLYFVLTVRSFSLSWLSLMKGVGLGIVATVLAALNPAREATGTTTRLALSRSTEETVLRDKLPLISSLSILSVVAGIALLMIPGKNLVISYSGILLLIIGFTLFTPAVMVFLSKLLKPLASKMFGMLGRMAVQGISSQMSRTTVAVAALSMAVAATVGVGTMVGSFRTTVIHWLEARLNADIYISAPSRMQRRPDTTMDPAFIGRIGELPEIASVNMFRSLLLDTPEGAMHVIGSQLSKDVFAEFQFKEGDPEALWAPLQNEMIVVISEPYAYHHDVKIGERLKIPTDEGEKTFQVAGIYYDYVSDIGTVLMSLKNYRQFWDDHRISGASVMLAEGYDAQAGMAAIRTVMNPGEEILLRSNKALLDTTVEVFNQTFMITNVLRLLAIVVAFIGVLSSLMALQLERRREQAVLRANGVTPKEIRRLVILQTGIMGAFAGVLALPMGTMLSYVLIYIINRRSFGWTLQFVFDPAIYWQAILLALLAALIAGIYPAIRMANASPALALRDE